MLTPPDVISQLSLAIPLMILYEGSIWSVKLLSKARKAAAAGGDGREGAAPAEARRIAGGRACSLIRRAL